MTKKQNNKSKSKNLLKISHKNFEELQRDSYKKELSEKLNIPEECIVVEELYIDQETESHHYKINIKHKKTTEEEE